MRCPRFGKLVGTLHIDGQRALESLADCSNHQADEVLLASLLFRLLAVGEKVRPCALR